MHGHIHTKIQQAGSKNKLTLGEIKLQTHTHTHTHSKKYISLIA